jgi:hypothetical protein
MKIKTRRTIRRILITFATTATIALFIAFVVFVVPTEYRLGPWRKVPQLDHRLLPHVSAIFAAAFGAFFGSLCAFHLGRMQQRADRREKRHAALIAAQYALMSQWNILEGIRVQHLERFRSHPNRFVKLGLFHATGSPTRVSFADLTFVLETDDPNVLQMIHIAEQAYDFSVQALNLRNEELNRFYGNPNVTHRILNFETGEGITEASQKDLFFVKEATTALYDSIDKALPKLSTAVEELHKLIRKIFPGMQALMMTPIPPASGKSSAL